MSLTTIEEKIKAEFDKLKTELLAMIHPKDEAEAKEILTAAEGVIQAHASDAVVTATTSAPAAKEAPLSASEKAGIDASDNTGNVDEKRDEINGVDEAGKAVNE
jgi:hypothetical protein